MSRSNTVPLAIALATAWLCAAMVPAQPFVLGLAQGTVSQTV